MACVLFVLLLTVMPTVSAQESVTEDDVARVAEQMYCPVCEMEPLDDCRAVTCVEWRAEIRRQLEAGNSDQAVIDNFVAQYGQHVVGVPQDPALRALSLVTPWLAIVGVIAIAGLTFRRWQQQRPAKAPSTPTTNAELDPYRERLEQDLA